MWLLLCSLARADDTVLTLEGEVPEGGPDHFLLPFEVPEGVVEIEVAHDDLSSENILDWGLDDPDGFRGWGGGNSEPAVVGLEAASRSYLPGPMPAGTWSVVVGKAKVTERPATYAVTVTLRTAATLAPEAGREPYVAAAPLRSGPGWFAGDLHVHSRDSGDASPTLDEIGAEAVENGLDFVVISDHNTVSQDALLVAAQARWPELLFLPGIEFTTYDGHAGAVGATEWVNHRIGLDGATIEAAAAAISAQGAFLVVNHPSLDLGELCIGCAWEQPLDPAAVGGVELITGGWDPVGKLFFEDNVALWESWLDLGHRVTPVGGSDDHKAGEDEGATGSPIGSPTTWVWAEQLDEAGILEGLRAGRAVIQLQGPGDPFLDLSADEEPAAGEDIPDSSGLTATVTGGQGGRLQWIVDGAVVEELDVDADPFESARRFDAPAAGLRVRAQWLVEGEPRVVTGYRYLRDAPAEAAGGGEAAPAKAGCGCGASGTGGAAPLGVGLLLVGLLGARRRR